MSNTEFTHHDLRSGKSKHVALRSTGDLGRAVATAIVGAHQGHGVVRIGDQPYQIFAEYSTAVEGNAYFFVSAAEDLGSGKVRQDNVVYTAVVACRLATAPLAWRHILKYYYREMMAAHRLYSFNAPGLMMWDVPWLVGFASSGSERLLPAEHKLLRDIVHVSALTLLMRCQSASTEVGPVAEGDTCYPELLDWDD